MDVDGVELPAASTSLESYIEAPGFGTLSPTAARGDYKHVSPMPSSMNLTITTSRQHMVSRLRKGAPCPADAEGADITKGWTITKVQADAKSPSPQLHTFANDAWSGQREITQCVCNIMTCAVAARTAHPRPHPSPLTPHPSPLTPTLTQTQTL